MATLNTLVSFNYEPLFEDSAYPNAGLVADAAGDLFGTTGGGMDGNIYSYGTVFEIAKNASTATTLFSCGWESTGPGSGDHVNNTYGEPPWGGLLVDAAGDLFGTTENSGTVFEIAKSGTGYASTPITLASFNYYTDGIFPTGLIADAAGDLIGTTERGGAGGHGTVFEIAKTSTGYASTPTTLINFDYTDGGYPTAGLIADAAGDLFGTTEYGGAYGYGTVFEIAKTSTGYASSPTTLVSFNGTDGQDPLGGLIADAAGNLFGTTWQGGATGDGTVFEIAKTSTGYASSPTTLVSFDIFSDGGNPNGGLIADAAGDLFGTTSAGGGTVFEIAKTNTGYASTPTTLVNFVGTNGAYPNGGLIADAAGDLFGTTWDGGGEYADYFGTVFELTDTGFIISPPPPMITGISPDTGISATDGVIDRTVTVVNGTVEAGSTVTIYAGTTAVGTGIADGTGAFSVMLASPLAVQGSYSLTATATGAFGSVSAASSPFTTTVDETRPTVTSVVASPEPADLGAGQLVTLTVDFSEAVYVTGTPTLRLPAQWGEATYTGGSGTDALTFDYTVQPGQNTEALAVYGVVLSAGATIDDAAGNPANLDGSVMALAGPVSIDTTAPAVTERLVADTGFSNSDGITWNSELIGRGDPNALVTFTAGGTTLGTTTAGATGTWTWTPVLADGTHTVVASETDGAGNTGTASLTFTLETTPPTVTSVVASPAPADFGAGETVTLTTYFSEVVDIGYPPTLRLNDGGMASYVGGSGTDALTFAYTVAGGQNTGALAAKGIVVALTPIENATGVAANVAGSVTALAGPVIIDTEHTRTTVPIGTGQTVDAGSGNDVVTLGQGNATLVFHGSNDIAFLGGTGAVNATITDQSSGLTIDVANGGDDVINGFAQDPSTVVDLLGGVGGYTNVNSVLAALTDDGAGGSSLAIGAGQSIDFTGVALGVLHAANFHIG